MASRMEARRKAMVERQIRRRGITDATLLAAFGEVPREAFVSGDLQYLAYDDRPLPIGAGQSISQPYIVACMIDAAGIRPGMRVLEVGAGSGYAAAVVSRIVGEVFTIERHEALAHAAAARIEALGCYNCHVVVGDGIAGLPEEAPFDAILVAASTDEAPDPLGRQLAIGGRMVLPVGRGVAQQLRCVERTGDECWIGRDIAAVRFVPLVPGVVLASSRGGTDR